MEMLISELSNHCGFNDEDCKFLANLCEKAYNREFNTDISTGGNKFEVGFKDLGVIYQSFIECNKQHSMSSTEVKDRLESNLLAHLRDVSLQEYKGKNLIEKDRELYEKLTHVKTDAEKDAELLEFIDEVFGRTIEESVAVIEGVYDCTLKDGFGLKRYEGVAGMLFGQESCKINESDRLIKIPNTLLFFKNANRFLSEKMGITVSTDRQFNIEKILNSDKPIYYPLKMIEFQGYVITRDADHIYYRPHKDRTNWGMYYKNHIREKLESLVKDTIYYILSKHDSEEWADEPVLNEVKDGLKKIQASVCCMVIVKRCVVMRKSLCAIGLRIVDVNNVLSVDDSRNILSGETTNESTYYNPGTLISAEYHKTLPFQIFDFEHDYDAKLSNAEPNFGYKAVELFTANKMEGEAPISWEHILIGEDLKGTSLFSGTGVGELKMIESLVHNVFAGSRAGKGVMTMNMLASAIASQKPVFYLDRKPDMATTLAHSSGGSMFVVNGADAIDVKPNCPYWDENTGSMISGWQESYDILPNYIKEVIGERSYYTSGGIGDMVYFRALMLCLAILCIRVTNNEGLGGDNGVVFVFDEISNWQKSFEKEYFSPTSRNSLNKNYLTDSVLSKISKLRSDIEAAQIKIQTCQKPENLPILQSKLDNLERQLEQMDLGKKAYCTTLLGAYMDSSDKWASSAKAGLNNFEGNRSDIFVIGQDLCTEPIFSVATKSYEFTKTQGQASCDVNKGSLLRGMFSQVGNDWFMGANINVGHRHCGANVEGSRAHRYLYAKTKNDMKGYWAYAQGVSLETINHKDPGNMKYFKPYLVLGNALDSDTYVQQCRDRVGADLWEDIRVRHLQEPYRTQFMAGDISVEQTWDKLNEGIGFDGLIDLTMKCNNPNASYDASILSSSGTIANTVVSALGYASYKDYLFDFTPEGIFSIGDICDIYLDRSKFAGNRKSRLKYFYDTGVYSDGSENSTPVYSESFDEEEEYDVDTDINDIMDDSEYQKQYTTQPVQESIPQYGQPTPQAINTGGNMSREDMLNALRSEPEPEPEIDLYAWADAIITQSGLQFRNRQRVVEEVVSLLRARGY